jgi:geranylgeranyl reductase family protein
MNFVSDAIVVGGGPCGSFASLNLAKHGANVAVLEEHSEIGVPSHCAGHLSIKGLKDLGLYPLPKGIVENVFVGANFCSPNGDVFTIRFPSPVTCAVNRILFDKYLAEMAETAGVHYFLGLHVESITVEERRVRALAAGQNGKKEFSTELVVDAEGISSRLLGQVGLNLLNRGMVVNGVEAEAEGVKEIEEDMVEVFLGKNYAPGFYAWLIPEYEGKAKVGLATQHGDPREFLHRLMVKHPEASKKLRTARITKMVFHPITLGGMIPKAYSDRFLAVGDVASQVKPTTGGGVILGLNCAKIAAEVANNAMREDDFSSRFLSVYQERCERVLGFDFRVMLRMHHVLDSLSDRKFDEAIAVCSKLGLDRTLQGVGDIDFQGQSFLRILRSPRALASLAYLFYLYLSANP